MKSPLLAKPHALALAVVVFVLLVGTAWSEDPAPGDAPAAAEAEKAKDLVQQLGDPDFQKREAAAKALAAMGEKARDALQAVAGSSESLEVRWRAQQLLKRLDGNRPRRLDPGATPPRPEAPRARDGSALWPEIERIREEAERLKKQLEEDPAIRDAQEELRRTLEQWHKNARRGGNPFLGALKWQGTVRAGALTLVHEGRTGVRLEIAGKTPTDRTTIHRGITLDAILAAHPELANHPDLAELKRKRDAGSNPFAMLEQWRRRGPAGGLPGILGPIVSHSTGGVKVTHTPDGVVVRITEPDANGEPVEKTYEGKSLEEIKAQHPEIADKLDAMGRFELHVGPPQILRPESGTIRELLERFRRGNSPVPPPGARIPHGARFGVGYELPEPALARHLRLPEGHGAIVRHVVAGSQAERIGLERHDVIVRVNGEGISRLDRLHALLVEAAKDESTPLELGIIRAGKGETLSR